MISAVCLSVTSFFRKINYLHFVLYQRLTKLFHAIITYVYIMLVPLLLNDNLVDIKNTDEICGELIFAVDKFSGLF